MRHFEIAITLKSKYHYSKIKKSSKLCFFDWVLSLFQIFRHPQPKLKCLVFSIPQSLLGLSWGNQLSNNYNYKKIQKVVLKFKKIAETEKWRVSWKIQNEIKSEWKEEYKIKSTIWVETRIWLKFWGFTSLNDPYQWSKFERNWQISVPDFRWSWLDWPYSC